MKTETARYFLGFFILAALLIVPATTHADTRIVDQLTADTTSGMTNMHWGTKFIAPTTTDVRSITLGVSAHCGNVALGHVETIHRPNEFIDEGSFSVATPIEGGYRFSGAAVPIVAGNTYYILHGSSRFPCPMFSIQGTASESASQNAQIYVVDANNFWLAQPASAFGSPIKDIAYSVCSDDSCTLTPPPPTYAECCSSVAFIPGIQATELYEGSSKRWLPGAFNSDAQRLGMTATGDSINDIRVGQPVHDVKFAGVKFFEVYGEFFNSLDVLKSTSTIKDWKSLPYDWRYDVYDVAAQGQRLRDGSILNLANEIRALAVESDTGKVTIFAHSNGGLVGKALIDVLGSDADLVDRFVMVGSPQLGTPETISSMVHGTGQGLPHRFLPISMTDATAREVMENMPGAYGLLPLAQYFNSVSMASSPMVTFDGSSLTASFRAAYGDTIDTTEELQSFMLGIGDGRVKPTSEDTFTPTILNSTLLADSLVTRNALEAWTPPLDMEVVQIAGWGLDTLYGFRYEEAPCAPGAGCSTFLDLVPKMTVEGDKTVVASSAQAQAGASTYVFNMSAFNDANGKSWTHVNMLSAASVHDLLSDIITHATRTAPLISASSPVLVDASKRLRLSVHSPITLGVRDLQGRFTGVISNPDPLSDIPLVVEEIPNSYYMEFGEGKYIGFEADEQHEVIGRSPIPRPSGAGLL